MLMKRERERERERECLWLANVFNFFILKNYKLIQVNKPTFASKFALEHLLTQTQIIVFFNDKKAY